MKGIIISFVIGICSFFLSQSAWGQAVGKLPEGDFDSWPARFHKKVLIDSISRLECIYDFTEIDTLLERMNEHRLILQVGEKATFVQDYNSYFTDSIFRSRNYELRNGEVHSGGVTSGSQDSDTLNCSHNTIFSLISLTWQMYNKKLKAMVMKFLFV